MLHNKFSITADQAKCFKLTSIFISDSADSGEYQLGIQDAIISNKLQRILNSILKKNNVITDNFYFAFNTRIGDGSLTDILYLMTQAYTALRVLIVESCSIPSLEFR